MNIKTNLILSLLTLVIVLSISVIMIIKMDNDHIEKLQDQVIQLQLDYKSLKNRKILDFYMLSDITITAYSPSIDETDNTPNITAIMESPIIGYTCAASRDLKYLLGKRIYIEGIGVFKVNDLMNKRYTKRFDLCMNKRSAMKFGIQKHSVVIMDR